MIKWFDADKFLPGREQRTVLIRYGITNDPAYVLGSYSEGVWYPPSYGDEDAYTKITHWAHINEPFE
jgi:hypothetical protein